MSTIAETGLPQEASTDADLIQTMQVRLIGADNKSKRKIVSEFILKLANIYGLTTALAGKIGLKATGSPDFITKFLTTGDIDFSTFKISTFDSLIAINSLGGNGFYTAAGTGSGYVSDVWGSTNSVIEMNSQQIVFTSTGVWMRTYSGSWSYPAYIGGATQNIVVTYAEAEALIAGGGLSVGAVYSIEDFDVTGYTKIILTAATSSTFFDDGTAFLPVPKYVEINAPTNHDMGGTLGDVTFYKEWHFAEEVVSVGALYASSYLHGKVYITEDEFGLVAGGTMTDWIPNTTPDIGSGWTYVNPTVNPEFYDIVQHSVVYDFTTNYVTSETNKACITANNGSLPEDGYQTRFNDWHVTFGTNIKCRRFYGMETCYNNSYTARNIDITGDLFNLYTTGHYGYIYINGIDGAYGSGSLKNIEIQDIILSINISGNSTIDGLYVYDAEGGRKTHLDVLGIPNRTVTYGTHETPITVGAFELLIGKISCAVNIGAGTFTIPTSWAEATIVTGCTVAVDRSNGITADTTYGRFTVLFTGWYRLSMQTSATVSAAATVEVQAFKNDTTPIDRWYNKKYYATTSSWQVSTLPNYPVYLTAGDVITFKYQASSVITVTLGQINRSLDYDG